MPRLGGLVGNPCLDLYARRIDVGFTADHDYPVHTLQKVEVDGLGVLGGYVDADLGERLHRQSIERRAGGEYPLNAPPPRRPRPCA